VEAQYEFKSVRAIRGTGAKTIAKWQKAGWELDTQRQGALRIEMTFRRMKPKDPWQQLAAFMTKSWAAFRRLETSRLPHRATWHRLPYRRHHVVLKPSGATADGRAYSSQPRQPTGDHPTPTAGH
jgi:hypothetical protein